MSYGDESEKTTRIFMLCATICILAGFTFAYKVDGCGPSPCSDKFIEINENNSKYHYTCDTGSTAEIVTSPPAPKAGVICHCNVKTSLDKK